MNIRNAILAAADHIERNPKDYDFMRWAVPDGNCKACMLGWIGHFLGMVGAVNNEVKRAISPDNDWDAFYCRVRDALGSSRFQSDASEAAKALRLYADKYHPAEPAKPLNFPDWNAIALTGYVPGEAVS